MHIPFRKQFEEEYIDDVIRMFEVNKIPEKQKNFSWDYDREYWVDLIRGETGC